MAMHYPYDMKFLANYPIVLLESMSMIIRIEKDGLRSQMNANFLIQARFRSILKVNSIENPTINLDSTIMLQQETDIVFFCHFVQH
jgi:hypothetical protein